MKRLTVFLSLSVLLMFTRCSSDPLNVDVSSIEVAPVKIVRFDSALVQADTTNVAAFREAMRKKYGAFSDAYFMNVVCYQAVDSLMCDEELRRYISDNDLKKMRAECLASYADLSNEEQQLTAAFRYFKYHFPKRQLPKRVFAITSGFSYNFTHTDGVYGIGLDYYLGEKSKWYDALQWPMFKRAKYNRVNIATGFVRSWLLNEFQYAPEKDDVLNRLVYEGKILYLSRAILRTTPDTILTGYSQQQLDWCEASEGSIWAAMIEKKLIYSELQEDINHMTEDAPFTAGFPRESPGGVGRWIGLRIVEAYMERNPTVTLEQLMQLNDAQVLLNKSKYKPKL